MDDGHQSNRKRVVTVIDSDPAVRFSLKFSLETEGLDVRVCSSAQEFLDVVGDEAIDCLIVEYRLQDMTGMDLVDRLRNRDFRVPVIIMASHPNRAIRQQADRRGVAIVEKPLIGNLLMETLARSFEASPTPDPATRES